MNILSNHNISNSLKINSKCRFFIEINEVTQFENLYKFVNEQKLPVLVIGEGTNIVPKDYFEGVVIKPTFNKVQYNTNDSTVSVGSSVNWHSFVKEMIKNKIYGFENLSLIPGSVGASPIQNIGAYGQEVSNLIARVDCFDYVKNKFLSLSNSDCNFSYRKSSLKDKPYIIFNIDTFGGRVDAATKIKDAILNSFFSFTLQLKNIFEEWTVELIDIQHILHTFSILQTLYHSSQVN